MYAEFRAVARNLYVVASKDSVGVFGNSTAKPYRGELNSIHFSCAVAVPENANNVSVTNAARTRMIHCSGAKLMSRFRSSQSDSRQWWCELRVRGTKLVPRFRSSHHSAARSFANFG